jgi:AcrR family transcriptional regulator
MTGLRAQQRQATQKAILSTARKLFHAATYDSVGVREIAAEAGVATGTVIAAFGSKVDLLHEIIIEDIEQQFDLMQQAVIGIDKTKQRLSQICLACLSFQYARIEIVRATMADAWTRSDNAENKIRKAMRPAYKFIIQEFERGIGRGDIRADLNLKLAATLVLESVINIYRVPLYDDTQLDALVDLMGERLDILLYGFGVPQTVVAHQQDQVSLQATVAA